MSEPEKKQAVSATSSDHQREHALENVSHLSALPQLPSTDDRGAWHKFWQSHHQPWRTEPEIDQERQRYLAQRLSIKPDIEHGIYALFLDVLAGYGYQPAKTIFWYLFVIGCFTTAYAFFGHLPPLPDALVFSFMSFHGRGFFPGLSNETNLHNPLVILAAGEAVIGLFIEISFIATFTRRFFGD